MNSELSDRLECRFECFLENSRRPIRLALGAVVDVLLNVIKIQFH